MLSDQFISRIIYHDDLPVDSYLRTLPVVKYLIEHGSLPFTKDVTFFVGDNGTGKSTLLEAIAVAYGFNPEGGTRNFNFSTNATHANLHEHLSLARSKTARDGFFLRAESFYNVASYLDNVVPQVINSYGGISLHNQSHGESFLTLVQNRFSGNGVYILDEPESALSPSKLLVLMAEMNTLIKRNSQFIIATHSPILMTFPNAQIYHLTDSGIDSVAYQETEHYQLTKQFLDNPDRILKHLLSE